MALAAATLAVYWRATGFDFVMYDDLATVFETPQVAAGLSWQGAGWALTHPNLANWHPVTTVSHMLDVTLFGRDAGGHHATSLLLHVLDTLLVFLVLERMTRAIWPSALVAALFGLHPMHVESIAWIAERKDVLSALFWLLTMLAYARYVERPGPGRYALTLVLFALGLMAKPMVVTLPFVLLLLDVWPLGRWNPEARAREAGPGQENRREDVQQTSKVGRSARSGDKSGDRPGRGKRDGAQDDSGVGVGADDHRRDARVDSTWARGLPTSRLLAEKIPCFALSLVSSIITFRVQQKIGAVPTVDAFPLGARIANALISYVRYMVKLIWPSGLSAFYPKPDVWPTAAVAVSAVVLLALTVLAVAMASRRPWLTVGWLWYVGTLVPVIRLVQVGMQSMADRYTYIPSIGLFMAIVWTLAEFAAGRARGLAPDRALAGAGTPGKTAWPAPQWTLIYAIAPCVVLLLLAVRTWQQVGVWQNTFTLFENAIAMDPDNPVARNVLGLAYAKQGRLDDAIAQLTEAARLEPSAATEVNLAFAYARKGSMAEAIRHYEAAVTDKPDDPKAQAGLGDALYHEGRLAEATARYEAALHLDPNQPDVLTNLGACLADQGRMQEAVARYTDSLLLRPASPETLNNLGAALASLGRKDEAVARYREAIRLRPDYADARENLANLLLSERRFEEAVPELEALVQAHPESVSARKALRAAQAAASRKP